MLNVLKPKVFKRKFDNKLNNLKHKNPEFKEFLNSFPDDVNIYVIGGFLRSVNDTNYKTRDLDIIVDLNSRKLGQVISKSFSTYKKNRMGGFKVGLSNIVLDIWNLENNYAHKYKHILNGRDLAGVSRSTFYNFDSISLRLRDNALYSKYYKRCIENKILDTIYANNEFYLKNPKKEFLLLRAIYLRKRYKLNLSHRLVKIFSYAHRNDNNLLKLLLEKLSKEEKYQRTITENDIIKFIKELSLYRKQ